MPCVRRARLTWAEKAELWRRWQRGESLSEIGRALRRVPGTVFHIVSARGGVPPRSRRRSRLALTADEREEISRGVARGWSVRRIGRDLGRAASTVSREVRRHGGRRRYRATVADQQAWAWSRRPKACRLATRSALRGMVAAKLARDWSPQQIAGWLRETFPGHAELHVSHETIYLSLFVQSRGVLRRALLAQLRRGHVCRRSRYARATGQGRGQIVDAVSIRERPSRDLASRQHDGEPRWCGRTNDAVDLPNRRGEHFLVEKQHCAERLILG